ncbi:MATE family efflux transporter [Bifidobacterium callitrichos]|uniref:Polysaccharide biosynthesis protein n=1 Tax=Bifidobacterium callitrichos DSM 23973 TaxID=1437609 RepID=A0A086ZUY7_9BIFI|nr:MATE family efflux transporter [Bifidobacterium callitrichos]KFI50337.1 polysaccharide biosynthesis protein [Bifidobacterium callitrichos DSM 23973]
MNRGLILNLISNLAFFISGYAIHFFLGGFASPAAYGVVGTVITVLDIEYLFVSNGARQSLSRTLSAGRYDPRDLIVKTLTVQMGIVAVFVLIDVAGAPVFGRVLGDRSLDLYMRLAAFLVPANGLYVVMLGINDGLKRFGHSALLSTLYPLIKLGTIPLIMFVFPDRPVIGVEVGYCASMVIVIALGTLMLAPYLIASHRRERVTARADADDTASPADRGPFRLPRIGWREAAHGTLAFSLFFIMASLVLSADTLVVKAILPDGMAGFYTGAMNFGKTTYYLLQAFAVIILPVVAGLIGEQRRDEALDKARDLVLLAVVFILPMAVSISATAADLLSSFYSRQFAVAAPALACLALSSFFMGATVVLNMVLNAERDTRFSDVLSVVSLPVVVIAFVVAARLGGITAVAAVSMGSTFLTMTVSYLEVRRRFGDVMSPTAWRAVGVNVVLWIVMAALGAVLPDRNFIVLVFVYMLEYAAYLTLLVAMGILDLKRIRQFAAGLGHARGEDGVRTVPNVPNVPSSAAGVDGAAR